MRPTPTPFVHEIVAGETLLDIALQYGVGLDEMLAANPGIDPRFLSIGQSLRIPGPEGEPVDTLLPTATPLPLEVSRGLCHRSPAGALICLATVSNPTNGPVEGITARVQLVAETGEVLTNELAFTPINRLPPGASLPLVAHFPAATAMPADSRFSLLSAVGSVAADERYGTVEIRDLESAPSPESRSWQLTAEIELSEAPGEMLVSVVALGISAEGQVVGYTKWRPDEGSQPPYRFDLLVFSLGPPIEEVEVLAEALIVPPK